jgi:hypothetical protein
VAAVGDISVPLEDSSSGALTALTEGTLTIVKVFTDNSDTVTVTPAFDVAYDGLVIPTQALVDAAGTITSTVTVWVAVNVGGVNSEEIPINVAVPAGVLALRTDVAAIKAATLTVTLDDDNATPVTSSPTLDTGTAISGTPFTVSTTSITALNNAGLTSLDLTIVSNALNLTGDGATYSADATSDVSFNDVPLTHSSYAATVSFTVGVSVED